MRLAAFKHWLLGSPLQKKRFGYERLPKWKALAVFSSDALSSVAYASHEVLVPLAAFSITATAWSLPIAVAITALLVTVGASYWQTIRAYPTGGGAYGVVRENLGTSWGLITAAALLMDYILTVAVSASAGIEAITSAFPMLYPIKVWLAAAAVVFVTILNLRGVRESSGFLALPTYIFIGAFLGMIGVGFYQFNAGIAVAKSPVLHEVYPVIPLWIFLRAFSSGCAALTGIEAICDGVPWFRPPESRNARTTLLWVVGLLCIFFLGATALIHLHGLTPTPEQTILSLLAHDIFGDSIFYYGVQIATAVILFLAANTSFADFPRVCSFLANDRFLPRQLASLGDRLVFSKGILLLGFFSIVLIFIFHGTTHLLIPLYAIGAFITFTLSQTGMIRYHWRHRGRSWGLALAMNAIGATMTSLVLLVLATSKFLQGAWIVLALIPLFVFWFRQTRDHYRKVGVQLALTEDVDITSPLNHIVVLPISGIHQGTVEAIRYAKSISDKVHVICVNLDETQTERLKEQWNQLNTGLELYAVPSPYRSVVQPILQYVRDIDAKEGGEPLITVLIPEFVTARWWESIYHNQTALMIRAALLFERRRVVTSVRHHLSR